MKILVSFHWDCGRAGDVESLFVCDKALLDKSIGKHVYFGEILGKHSEVYGTLEKGHVQIVSDDQEKIEWLIAVTKTQQEMNYDAEWPINEKGEAVPVLFDTWTITGHNPLTHIQTEEEEE